MHGTHPAPRSPARRRRVRSASTSRMSAEPASASSPSDVAERPRAPRPDPAVLEEPEQQPWIDAAGACRHDQALDRCEPHRRVDGAAAVHSRQRGTGTEVAADHPQLLGAPAQELGSAARHVGVREAVEAEAAQRMTLAPLTGERVRRGGLREVTVKGRVEACDSWSVRQHGGDCGHRVEGGGLVQGRQWGETPQRLGDLGVQPHGSDEPRAAWTTRWAIASAPRMPSSASRSCTGSARPAAASSSVLASSSSSSPRRRSLSELDRR